MQVLRTTSDIRHAQDQHALELAATHTSNTKNRMRIMEQQLQSAQVQNDALMSLSTEKQSDSENVRLELEVQKNQLADRLNEAKQQQQTSDERISGLEERVSDMQTSHDQKVCI